MNLGVNQELYDETKELNSTTYSASAGLRWELSNVTVGEILGGYQYLRFNNAQASGDQSLFQRTADSYDNFFFMGDIKWTPTPFLTVWLQGYRSFQQTVVFGSLFFTATGANLSAVHELGDRAALTLNLGLENDDFQGTNAATANNRVDLIKSVSAGVTYRALKWVGAGFQYVFEDRNSTEQQFNYYANTFMVSLQATF
jgi:hypothetical protein